MPQSPPPPDREDSLHQVLQSVVLDRQTRTIKTPDGTAVMLPLQAYIKLSYMERTLMTVIMRSQEGDLMGLNQVLDSFSIWFLRGGGEEYIEYPPEAEGGGTHDGTL